MASSFRKYKEAQLCRRRACVMKASPRIPAATNLGQTSMRIWQPQPCKLRRKKMVSRLADKDSGLWGSAVQGLAWGSIRLGKRSGV